MRVFVAWDFSDHAAAALLAGVDRFGGAWRVRGEKVEWTIPGINNPRDSGVIGSDIVARRIKEADLVVGFLGGTNANVGWELGLALGLGKRVRLVTLKGRPRAALDALAGVSVQQVFEFQDMADALHLDDWFIARPPDEHEAHLSCVLCPKGPEGSGLRQAVTLEKISAAELAEPWGFKLATEGAELARYARVIWVVAMEAVPGDRDGYQNASNAVVAGFARGAGRSVSILCSRQARQLVDVIGETVDFRGVDEFLERLRATLAVSGAPSAPSAPTLSVSPSGPLEESALLQQLQKIFPRDADIRELAARAGVDRLLERSTPDQAWADVLRQIRNGSRDVGVLVEAGLTAEPENATFTALALRGKKISPQ